MALPQKVADRLQWEAPQTQGWSTSLIMFCLTLFIISVAVWVGLKFGYTPFLTNRKNTLDKQIDAFKGKTSSNDQAKLLLLYSQISNLKTLLSQEVVLSPVIDWIGASTQVNVFYKSLAFNTVARQFNITAVAKSITDFEQQVKIYKADPFVREVTFSGLTKSKEGWQFGLVITVDPRLLGIAATSSVAVPKK